MKLSKFYLPACIAFMLIISAVLPACKQKHCAYLVCQNGGYCDADTCVCQPGFYSALCQNNLRDQYLGTYKGTLTISPSTTGAPGTVTVTAGTGATDIILTSPIITLTAQLSPGGYFVIPSQSNTLGTASGSGAFRGNSLEFDVEQSIYTITINSNFKGEKQP